MLKIAVIFESCPFDRKGLFNAVHNRVKHLVASGGCEVDVYCVHSLDSALTRHLRHTPEVPVKESVTIEGVCYNLLWYRFSILDHLTVSRLHRKPLFFQKFIKFSSVSITESSNTSYLYISFPTNGSSITSV